MEAAVSVGGLSDGADGSGVVARRSLEVLLLSSLACGSVSILSGLDADSLFTSTTSSGGLTLSILGSGNLKVITDKTTAWRTTDTSIATLRREDALNRQPELLAASKSDMVGVALTSAEE